jgi:arginase
VSKIILIGVPLDLGGNRRGVDMGPSALRITGLAERIRALGLDVIDSGDVSVPLPELLDSGDEHSKYAGPIAAVCEELC